MSDEARLGMEGDSEEIRVSVDTVSGPRVRLLLHTLKELFGVGHRMRVTAADVISEPAQVTIRSGDQTYTYPIAN